MESSNPGVIITAMSLKDRLIRAAAGFLPIFSVAIIALLDDELVKFCFYFLSACILGTWLYTKKEIRKYDGEYVDSTNMKGEKIRVFNYSIAGMEAKLRDEAESQAKWNAPFDLIEKLMDIVWVRYIVAICLAILAYWLSTVSTSKAAYLWVFIIGCYSVVLAKELVIWVVGAAIVLAIIGALLGAASTLSIPVAIIIGATIIAMAVRK